MIKPTIQQIKWAIGFGEGDATSGHIKIVFTQAQETPPLVLLEIQRFYGGILKRANKKRRMHHKTAWNLYLYRYELQLNVLNDWIQYGIMKVGASR